MYIYSQCLRSPRSTQLPVFTREPVSRIWPGPTKVVRRRVGTVTNSRGLDESSLAADHKGDRYVGDSKDERQRQSVKASAEQDQVTQRRTSPVRFVYGSANEDTSRQSPSQESSTQKRLVRYPSVAAPNSQSNTNSHQDRQPPTLDSMGSKSFRDSLSAKIQRDAHSIRLKLNELQFDRELRLRLLSLYSWSIIHRKWRRTFILNWENKRNGHEPDSEFWDEMPVEEDEVRSWVEQIVPTPSTRATYMSIEWRRLPRTEMTRRWPFVMQWLLRRSPEHAVKFLHATNRQPRPGLQMVADCFRYLEAFHHDELTADAESKKYYYWVLFSCLRPENWPMVIPAGSLQVFAEHGSHSTLSRGFSEIREWNIRVSPDTLLRFMDSFAKFGDVENSVLALRLALSRKPKTDLTSEVFQNRLCNLLKLDEVVDTDGVRNFKILPTVLELKVPPGRDMMNLILSNVMKTGDSKMVLDVADHMKQQGFSFDSYTYVSLIKDAVGRRDVEQLDNIFEDLDKNEYVRKDPYVTSQILHALFSLGRKAPDPNKSHSDTFNSMLDVYSRAHDLTPLRDLGIIRPHWPLNDWRTATPPSMPSLTLMIGAYLRKLTDPDLGSETFNRFQEMVKQGNEHFGPLAEFDYIYNTFLMSFVRSSSTIPDCVKVVEQMLQPLPPTAVLKNEENRQIHQAKPTVRTWTILLSAYMFRGEVHAAEKIRTLMAKQGIEFNDHTWNVAITGYAKKQMVQELAAALRSMEKDKVPVDSHTIQAVRQLRDPEKLCEVLNILDEELENDESRAVYEKNEVPEKEG